MTIVSLLDPIGSACSLLAVFYFVQARTRAFPLTLLSIVVNSVLYYHKGIYAHLCLEAFYLSSSLYGWYTWSFLGKKATEPAVLVRKIPMFWLVIFTISVLMAIPFVAYLLKTYTDSTIPYWDATTTILALLAQWMLCKKWIECWAVWFGRDFLVVILHWTQNIPFHSFTHFVYLIMAILGYIKWRQIMGAQKPACTEAPLTPSKQCFATD